MPRAVNIVCIGDSLTEGGYPRILQDLLGAREPAYRWNVHNVGILGASTTDWLQTHLAGNDFRKAVAGGVDAYVVMLGTNDCQVQSMFNEQAFRDRLTRLVLTLQNEGAAVLLATIPPAVPGGSYTQYMNLANMGHVQRIIPQVAAATGCPVADAFAALGGVKPNPAAFSDGVHLVKEGNRLIAVAVLNAIHQLVMSRVGGGALPKGRPSLGVMPNGMADLVSHVPSPLVPPPALPALAGPPPRFGPQLPAGLAPAASPSKQKQMQGKNFTVGAPIEIWSKTWDTWFRGRVARMDGTAILAEFWAPDGKEKEKWMPIGHPEMRLAQQPPAPAMPPQAPIVGGSPVNGSPVSGGYGGCMSPPAVGAPLPCRTNRAFADSPVIFSEGQQVEHLASADGRWYRGVVVGAHPVSGYFVKLDNGHMTSVAFPDVQSRLRHLPQHGSASFIPGPLH